MNTPVVLNTISEYNPTSKPSSLLDKILAASSKYEIDELIKLAKTYKKASPGTMKKWARAISDKTKTFK